jgi:Holliday junction resolvasome RuvABC endonuclease subunit
MIYENIEDYDPHLISFEQPFVEKAVEKGCKAIACAGLATLILYASTFFYKPAQAKGEEPKPIIENPKIEIQETLTDRLC